MRRAGTILLVLFQAFWLNVVVPGHTRGAITLPGTAGPSEAHASARGAACCASHAAKSNGGKSTPTPDERTRCAICSFAAALSTPPAVDTTLAPQGLSHALSVAMPEAIETRHVTLPYDGRGPPLA